MIGMNEDGTITAVVATGVRVLGESLVLTLQMPQGQVQGGVAGRYWLARCGAQSDLERAEQWSIYFRRALFIVGRRAAYQEKLEEIDVLLPGGREPGYEWLAALDPHDPINLLGPFGQGFVLHEQTRNLLLLADLRTVAMFLPLVDELLDRQGRVTLILSANPQDAESIITRLPISVEVHVAQSDDEWQQHLDRSLAWSDQLCAATPRHDHARLVTAIRRNRFHLQEGFAQVLVEADLVCGVGACLACVVPTADGGLTRACVHGPVFDLVRLAR